MISLHHACVLHAQQEGISSPEKEGEEEGLHVKHDIVMTHAFAGGYHETARDQQHYLRLHRYTNLITS